jgi:hypothetical protein
MKHLFQILAFLSLTPPFTYAHRSLQVMQSQSDESDMEEQIVMAIQEAPVHNDILTTVFWIGERAKRVGWTDNLDSAWDARWKENFGGLDSPVYRNGFFPARFKPKQNPFYIALPFNDISNPAYVDNCPMLQYFKSKKANRTSSVCKNNWIEIICNGKACYAQWQDVGPIFTDDYEYVFGSQAPRAHNKEMAGLDVSPAIRDFLGLKDTVRTSWRFIEESKVPEGPWKTIVTRS